MLHGCNIGSDTAADALYASATFHQDDGSAWWLMEDACGKQRQVRALTEAQRRDHDGDWSMRGFGAGPDAQRAALAALHAGERVQPPPPPAPPQPLPPQPQRW